VSADLARYQRELAAGPALVRDIRQALPPEPPEPERVIRCSRDRVDEAVAEAIIRARDRREVWRVEIVEERR
jgi:hypothetical protein